MPVNKKSQIRINVLLRMMKDKKYPNYPKLLQELKNLDIAGVARVSEKTIQRDIKFLKEEFKAPIKYDYVEKGYYLDSQYWDKIPYLEEVETDAAVFGAQLAGGLIPQSKIKQNIRTSTDALWSKNNGKHDDTMVITALMATGATTKINPDFFQIIFEAWQKLEMIQMRYKRVGDGYILDMKLEPHVLVFHNNNWYLRARLLKTGDFINDAKTFLTLALQRVQGVVNLGIPFDIDPKEVKNIQENGIFAGMPKLPVVKLHLRNNGLTALENLTPITEAKLDDGSIIITLEQIYEYQVMNLVLASAGNVTIIEPLELKEKALSKAKSFIYQQEKTYKTQND